MDEAKLAKLKAKLEKLKEQFENAAFQQYAPQEVKDKLRRRVS
jgi:hypothetical protein